MYSRNKKKMLCSLIIQKFIQIPSDNSLTWYYHISTKNHRCLMVDSCELLSAHVRHFVFRGNQWAEGSLSVTMN